MLFRLFGKRLTETAHQANKLIKIKKKKMNKIETIIITIKKKTK